MADTELRCPVTWRFLHKLRDAVREGPSAQLYEPELDALNSMLATVGVLGRSHSVQLLRSFYLLEVTLAALWAASARFSEYNWEPLLSLQQGVPERSYTGLTRVLDVMRRQRQYFDVDALEARLGGIVLVDGKTVVHKKLAAGGPNLVLVGQAVDYLVNIASAIRANLVEPNGAMSLGVVGVDAQNAMQLLGVHVSQQVNVGRVLGTITEGAPLVPWTT